MGGCSIPGRGHGWPQHSGRHTARLGGSYSHSTSTVPPWGRGRDGGGSEYGDLTPGSQLNAQFDNVRDGGTCKRQGLQDGTPVI